MITDEGTAVDESWEVAAAEGALTRINADGGIAGHKVKLIFCNEDLNPNEAEACARQLIADHVIAFDGNQPLAAEANVDELMRSAGIANVAPSSYGPTDSDPNSYELFGGQTFVNAAQIMFGEEYAGPKVAVSLLDSPLTTAFIPFYKKALPSLHGELVGTATSSQTATDVSPQAADLVATHPDWIDTNSAPQAVIGIAEDASQLGFTGHVVVSGTELTQSEIEGMGAAANQLLFVSPFPPVGDASKYPAVQNFVTDMKAEAAAGNSAAPDSGDYVPFLAENAYFGMIAIANVATEAKATTPAAFKTAISSAKSVSLGAGLPAWSPNASISKAVPRASSGLFYFSKWSDGKEVLVGSNPVDVTAVANAGTS
jgi:ABC-type branched-subunit amino acid transport system substrate-binding protein